MERRNFLVGAASLGAASIAGCSLLSSDSGGGGPSPLTGVQDWLVSPAETDGELQGYSVDAVSLSAVFDKADRLGGDHVADLHEGVLPHGVELERGALEHSAWVFPGRSELGLYRVTTGSFDGKDVAAAVENSGYSRESDRGEYELFTWPVDDDWVAVADDRLLWSSFGRTELPTIERTVDAIRATESGDESALFELDGAHRTVSDRLPGGDYASIAIEEPDDDPNGVPGEFEGVLAHGDTRTYEDTQTGSATVVIEFESEGAVQDADLESYVDRLEVGSRSDADYEVDGTTVEITVDGDRDVLP